jgi:hypothetical protein
MNDIVNVENMNVEQIFYLLQPKTNSILIISHNHQE